MTQASLVIALALAAGCTSAGLVEAPAASHAQSPGEHAGRPEAETAVDPASCEGEPDGEIAEQDVIRPDGPVPSFSVASSSCVSLRSEDLVGKRPLVLVFFSSWCAVCDKKMPVVKRAVDALRDEATFIGVALDDDETWPNVEAFVQRYELAFPVVRGARFRRFAYGYNPMQSVPVIVVVGRSGLLVDLQVGYTPFDYNRLVGAVEVAKGDAPEPRRPP